MEYNGELFVERLKEIAGVKKQSELSKKINIDETRISRWITANRYPQTETLLEISKTLNCSLDSIVGNTTESNNPPKDFFSVLKDFMILDISEKIPFEFDYKITKGNDIRGYFEIIEEDETNYLFTILFDEYMKTKTAFDYISNNNMRMALINSFIDEWEKQIKK